MSPGGGGPAHHPPGADRRRRRGLRRPQHRRQAEGGGGRRLVRSALRRSVSRRRFPTLASHGSGLPGGAKVRILVPVEAAAFYDLVSDPLHRSSVTVDDPVRFSGPGSQCFLALTHHQPALVYSILFPDAGASIVHTSSRLLVWSTDPPGGVPSVAGTPQHRAPRRVGKEA